MSAESPLTEFTELPFALLAEGYMIALCVLSAKPKQWPISCCINVCHKIWCESVVVKPLLASYNATSPPYTLITQMVHPLVTVVTFASAKLPSFLPR